jgi:hypothetical protein
MLQESLMENGYGIIQTGKFKEMKRLGMEKKMVMV